MPIRAGRPITLQSRPTCRHFNLTAYDHILDLNLHCSYGIKYIIHHLRPISKHRQVHAFRTLFVCVSLNFFHAFLSHLLIDALRF